MPVTIKITAGGIFGADGEVPVGTEITLSEEPKGWDGRYVVISGDGKGKTGVTNPKADDTGLKAVHRGAGSYSIVDRSGKEVLERLDKAAADEFNAMDDDQKAAAVEAALAERAQG